MFPAESIVIQTGVIHHAATTAVVLKFTASPLLVPTAFVAYGVAI